MRHQARSSAEFLCVFHGTAGQAGDSSLLVEWNQQIKYIAQLGEQGLLMILGWFSLLREVWPLPRVWGTIAEEKGEVIQTVILEEIGEGDLDHDEEEDLVQTIDNSVLTLALEKLGLGEEFNLDND